MSGQILCANHLDLTPEAVDAIFRAFFLSSVDFVVLFGILNQIVFHLVVSYQTFMWLSVLYFECILIYKMKIYLPVTYK